MTNKNRQLEKQDRVHLYIISLHPYKMSSLTVMISDQHFIYGELPFVSHTYHAAALIGKPLTVITWCNSQIPNLNWISLIFVMLAFSTQFWRLHQWYRAAAGQGVWDQHGLALVWSDSTSRLQPPASGTHIHQPSDDQQKKVTLHHS